MIEKLRQSTLLRQDIKLTDSRKKGKDAMPVNSVIRACKIIECLSNNNNSIKEIAEQCGLSISTVHRLLQTLIDSELVFKNPIDQKYYLGRLFTRITLSTLNNHKHFIYQSIDEVQRIWDIFGEFTALDIEVGLQINTLIEIQSRFNYIIAKSTMPMFYGSVSKVMMAQHSDDEIATILKNVKLAPTSKDCITNKKLIKESIKEIRHQGYCVSRREIDEGIMGISVPISNYVCAASLSVVGPDVRLEPKTKEILQELLVSASNISNRITQNNG